MDDMLRKIEQTGIVPVVVLEDEKDALPLAKTLQEAGMFCMEVTFRTKAAFASIKSISENCKEMLVGAGTVLTVDQVDQAMEAGAKFVVSPGLNPKIVSYCQKKNLPIIPGCITPGEVEQALDFGLKAVKFFPAKLAGGLPMIKALASVYPEIRFMPTGGIDLKNAGEYLEYDRVLACGGSYMVKADMIRNHQFDEIAGLTKETVELVKQFR